MSYSILWISNQVYLNQAYLRGGIEKCCRKKIEQEIVLKRNYSKILCKSIMTQVCIDEQQNVKRWQNITKRSHIFPEPEKHTVSIFNRVLLSESERIAALLTSRRLLLGCKSLWFKESVSSQEERGGEGVMRKLLSSLASTRSDTEGPGKPVQSSSRPFWFVTQKMEKQ